MQHVQGEEWGFPRSFITVAFIPQIHFCELWKESDAHFYRILNHFYAKRAFPFCFKSNRIFIYNT